MVQPFTSCSCTPPKCYSALEVLPCGKGLSVYSEPDGQTQSVFSFWPRFSLNRFSVPGPDFHSHHRKTIVEIAFSTGGTPIFELEESEKLRTGPSFTLIVLVAARDSRPASPIRILIRRAQLPEPRTAPGACCSQTTLHQVSVRLQTLTARFEFGQFARSLGCHTTGCSRDTRDRLSGYRFGIVR